MDLRKLHNEYKRYFIEDNIKEGQIILDAGCGCGGDVHKWSHQNVIVYACDPDSKSVKEAKRRTKGSKKFHFFDGDISSTPVKQYDVICYNFSIHYIFSTEELFLKTIKNIKERSKIGTKVIGIVPDSEEIILAQQFKKDSLGNEFSKGPLTGGFGDTVQFNIAGSPFYKNGPILEPVCYKELLITYLEREGFILDIWTPFIPFTTALISDMYSKFIFTCVK